MTNKDIKILGIESSCDETAASVVAAVVATTYNQQPTTNNIKVEILSNVVASQIDLHKKYGGVYPELASRAHAEKITPVLQEALGISNFQFPISKALEGIDAIAVTYGPGLIGSLMVGVTAAKTLAYATGKPVIPINHWEGHVYSNFIRVKAKGKRQKAKMPGFPSLILTVSGGHTSLILMKGHGKYEILGQTQDDAAGEAFDKVAKLLGLGYPGGPEISRLAGHYTKMTNDKLLISNQAPNPNDQNNKFKLPIPMVKDKSFNFSFSGLKTAVYYRVRDRKLSEDDKIVIAYNFQEAVIESLMNKFRAAAKKFQPKSVCLAGGVSANIALRRRFEEVGKKFAWQPTIYIPEPYLSTDNAAMIATAGVFHFLAGKTVSVYDVDVDAGAKLK